MLHYRPHQVYSTYPDLDLHTPPDRRLDMNLIMNHDTSNINASTTQYSTGSRAQTQKQTQAHEGLEDPAARTPSDHYEYLEVESVDGQGELEAWRQNTTANAGHNGASERAEAGQPPLQVFTPPPATTYNAHPAAFDSHYHSVMSQAQRLSHAQAHAQAQAQAQAHHNQHHYYPGPASNSPPPPHTHHQYHSQAHYQQNGNYPSSISSNDRNMTQEEADLKRLRNTAASARFRAKKKRREQSLERSSREKKERLQALEGRIRDLEAENQWLKDLIMEKNDVRTDADRVRARYGEDTVVVSEDDRKGYERKDGVGT